MRIRRKERKTGGREWKGGTRTSGECDVREQREKIEMVRPKEEAGEKGEGREGESGTYLNLAAFKELSTAPIVSSD